MPDRVRGAVFDMLGALHDQPGAIPSCRVADLFAGSGSMGLEALSRGASACDFIEKGPLAVQTLKANIDSLDANGEANIVRLDAWSACLTTPKPSEVYRFIFLDPPYADARDNAPRSKVCTLLGDLFLAAWANEQTTIMLHHEDSVLFQGNENTPWLVFDRRTYGDTAITFIQHRNAS